VYHRRVIRARLAALAVLVVLVGAGASCIIDVSSDVVGRACPCPGGYVCLAGKCGLAPDCTPLVTVGDFRAGWSTPETILWSWTPAGRPEDLRDYQLVIASSVDDVLAVSGTARIFDRTVNPELGYYVTPHETSAVALGYTVTDGLEPLDGSDPAIGRYFARLFATDTAGCPFGTDIVEGRTKLPPLEGEVVIFDDELIGETWGAPLVVEPGAGVDGSAALRCSEDGCLNTDTGSPEWDHLRVVQPIDLTGVSENAIVTDQAFLELSVAVVSEVPAFYTEIYLEVTGGGWVSWRRVHLRARADGVTYQHVQVPLAELRLDSGEPIAPTAFQSVFDGFQLGGSFIGATDVYLDAIAVRW
jgi:hypothetical protein